MSEARRNGTVYSNSGTFPLHLAILQGDIERIKVLLAQDDVNANKCSRTIGPPLCFAAERGQVDAVRVLLDSGKVDILSTNKTKKASYYGLTAIDLAARRGNHEVIKVLFERGIKLFASGDDARLRSFKLALRRATRAANCSDILSKTLLKSESGKEAYQANINFFSFLFETGLQNRASTISSNRLESSNMNKEIEV